MQLFRPADSLPRQQRLGQSEVGGDRPRTVSLAALSLFVCAGLNAIGTGFSIGALSQQGHPPSSNTVLVWVLIVVGLMLVGVPTWIGIASLRGSDWAAVWSIFLLLVELLTAFQTSGLWGYLVSGFLLLAVVLLWQPVSRAYARNAR